MSKAYKKAFPISGLIVDEKGDIPNALIEISENTSAEIKSINVSSQSEDMENHKKTLMDLSTNS